MILRPLSRRAPFPSLRLAQMSAQFSERAFNGASNGTYPGVSLQDLPKSSVFTSSLPPDPQYQTPTSSHRAPREDLGPRTVKGALYTYVRPEHSESPELLGISRTAMRDIGLRSGQEDTEDLRQLVAGNKIFWDERTEEGVYPWAQCYGGSPSPVNDLDL